MPPIRALVIHPDDDVAVLVEAASAGDTVEAQCGASTVTLTARQAIPTGHKVALRDLAAGSPLRKYGEKIGLALQDIRAGEHVHLHNLAGDRVKV
ncbi:MAG: hypothetical protein FJX74_21845 [Armatimonadetes bacterium]|nr:hypothetical protein [Armatimonadota bacterium]